jgi:hypothetical protein
MSNIIQNGGIIYIQQSGNNIQYQSNSTSGSWTNVSSWPVNFINSNPVEGNVLTVSLYTNITISNTTVGTGTNGYFICGSSYITYDGTGKTITINTVTNYPGLINNGAELINGYSNITVQNILLTTISSTLVFRGGWICQSFFGNSSFNTLISNCHVDAPIGPNNQCGGICGRGFGQGNGTLNSSSALIIECSKTGLNDSPFGGAITSLRTGQLGGNVRISNCYNTGAISNDCSGVCGQQAGQDSGKVEIIMCYNTGAIISSIGTGGICGGITGTNNGTISISNCYNSGAISSQSAGGICGTQAGENLGKVSISNCYNTGAISGQYSGGICGIKAGNNNGSVSIINCYNTGAISGQYSGGIAGAVFGINSNKLCSIINCYNTSDITGSNAGGITGTEVGYNNNAIYTPKILIQNCYSLGNIGTTCGGICGGTEGNVYTNIPVVNITNCYTSYNSIIDSGSQYISTSLPTAVRNAIILKNVYNSLLSSWSDTDANNSLSGSLSIFKNSRLYKYYSNFGEVWYSNQNNTPFNLTSYLNTVPRRKRINNIL